MHQKTAQALRGTDVCAKELQVTRAALLRYRGAMAGVVRSMGVNGPTVEDVVHDAFEMACRKEAAERPDPRDENRFGGWLCTLAKYAALTARNDWARSREISSPTEELEDAADTHAVYFGNFDDKVAASVVFANLGAEDRKLLHQHFYEEKTVQELAVERGVPWTTMRSRLDGVIERARSIMDDKSYRRRGWGAVALCWLVLHVRELQLRMQSAWAQSKRMALAGALGFVVTGGAVTAALMALAEPSAVVTHAGQLGTVHSENVVASMTPHAGKHVQLGWSPTAEPIQVVDPSAKKVPPRSGTARRFDINDRSRVTLPWPVFAALRDAKPKGIK